MSAGKGDSARPVNLKVYRENYQSIDWAVKRESLNGESHLEFMRSMGFNCSDEEEAYHLRGLLDM